MSGSQNSLQLTKMMKEILRDPVSSLLLPVSNAWS